MVSSLWWYGGGIDSGEEVLGRVRRWLWMVEEESDSFGAHKGGSNGCHHVRRKRFSILCVGVVAVGFSLVGKSSKIKMLTKPISLHRFQSFG